MKRKHTIGVMLNPSSPVQLNNKGKKKKMAQKKKTSSSSSKKSGGTSRKAGGRKKNNPTNPAPKKSTKKTKRPSGRRRNPATTKGLLGTALVSGLGVSLFETGVNKFMPSQAPWIRIGTKLGGAWAIQKWGKSIPLVGQHAEAIALVLATLAVTDAYRTFVYPKLMGVAGQLLPFQQVSEGAAEEGLSGYQLIDPYSEYDPDYADF